MCVQYRENVCTMQSQWLGVCVRERAGERRGEASYSAYEYVCDMVREMCVRERMCERSRENVCVTWCETECVYDRERMGVRYRVSD